MRLKFIFVLVLIFSSALWYVNHGAKEQFVPHAISHLPANNPIYATYDYSCAENAVRIGVQPLYLPTGLITETMRRDNILRLALSKIGQEICFYPLLKGADVNYFLEQGDLDGGVGGDMPAISAAANLNVVIPTMVQQGFLSIVANRQMFIKELRNKRLGFTPGSNAHFALLSTLASAGLNEMNTTLIPLEVAQMPEALHKGSIDAFSAWEPTPTIALLSDKESQVIHQVLSTGYLYFTQSFIKTQPEAVRKIIAAEIRALKWLAKNNQNKLVAATWSLEAAESLTGIKSPLSPELVSALAKKDILRTFTLPFIHSSQTEDNGPLHKEFSFLLSLGKVKPTSNWNRVRNSFDRSIMEDVVSQPDTYLLNRFEYDLGEVANVQKI